MCIMEGSWKPRWEQSGKGTWGQSRKPGMADRGYGTSEGTRELWKVLQQEQM